MKTTKYNMVFRAKTFGSAVYATRIELGMSQTDIRNLTGYSHMTSIESGDCATMQIDTFLNICNALDLNPMEFFGLEE